MNSFDKLDAILEGKDVLCIPIISSINRQTGEYNLSADGNVNRIITTFWHCNMRSLTIILPKKHVVGSEKIFDRLVSYIGEKNVHLVYCDNFGVHAGEQRSKPSVYRGLMEELKEKLPLINHDKYTILFESQYIGMNLLSWYDTNNMVFWNYVCEIVPRKTRSFLTGYDEINRILAKRCRYTILASPETLDYYNHISEKDNIIYCPVFVDRSLPMFNYIENEDIKNLLIKTKIHVGKHGHIWYIPYRMTDEGYQMGKVIDFINTHHEKSVILYSDPNNSEYMEKIRDRFDDNVSMILKVSTDRDVYYTILDSGVQVEIPYFEDLPFINHAGIWEFSYKDCNAIVYLDNSFYINYTDAYDLYKCPNIKFV